MRATASAQRIASHVPVDRPHVGFVNGNVKNALATLDRVATVAQYAPTATYPNTGLGQALRAVAGAIVRGIGTKVFWVQTGGFDTHASQGSSNDGAYAGLMSTVNDAVYAFYVDMANQGLIGNTTILQFSEFARRVEENGSQGTDHGSGAPMLLVGGRVRSGLVGEHPSLVNLQQGNLPFATDFRQVYATLIEGWLGADSQKVLGQKFETLKIFRA